MISILQLLGDDFLLIFNVFILAFDNEYSEIIYI